MEQPVPTSPRNLGVVVNSAVSSPALLCNAFAHLHGPLLACSTAHQHVLFLYVGQSWSSQAPQAVCCSQWLKPKSFPASGLLEILQCVCCQSKPCSQDSSLSVWLSYSSTCWLFPSCVSVLSLCSLSLSLCVCVCVLIGLEF